MKHVLLTVAAMVIAGCVSPGTADQAREATPSQQQQTERVATLTPEDPGYWDEIVCRREPLTGTRLTKSRCHSRYDWERMRGAAKETMRDILAQPLPCGSGAGCAAGD